MELDIERVDRLGTLSWHGYSSYVQEVKKKLLSNEKAEVYTYEAIEMPDECGQRINILV
jgi:hypothetical protein